MQTFHDHGIAVIQGIGGALMIPGSLAIISATFSPEEKGKAIGTWSAITTIVSVCGPVLGGALADAGLWRFIFYINIPLGILSFLALQYKVPESREAGESKIDWVGVIILITCLTFLTFGLLETPILGIDHWIVLSFISTGVILIVVFLVVEKKSKHPMIPLELFSNNIFSGVNLLSFTLYAGLGAIMLFLSLNIIQIQGYSQLQAGMTFLPFSFLMIVFGRKMGGFTDKYGARIFLIVGPILTGTGMLLLSLIGKTEGPSEYWTTYLPPFLLFAIGMSITVVPLTTSVMTSVDESKSGIASGINNSVTRVAGTFIIAISGALAIYWFSEDVLNQINNLAVNSEDRKLIMAEAINLGDAKSPEFANKELVKQINLIFENSFLNTYRNIGLVSAGLAYISALIAFFMVKKS